MTPSRAQDGATPLWFASSDNGAESWVDRDPRLSEVLAWDPDSVEEYRALPLAAYQALVARGERQEAEIARLNALLAEFVHNESRGEPYPPRPE